MIHHFLHSGEQAAVIQSKKGIVNVTYKNKETAIHTILLRIFANFIQGKSSLVVIPDAEDKKQLTTLIRQCSLNHATLEIILDNETTEEDFHLIRQKMTQLQSFHIENDETAAFLHHETDQEILSFYKNTYLEEIWDGASWREILDTYIGLHSEKNVNILHTELDQSCFEFTPKELNDIRSSISDALYVYQRDFEIIEFSEKSKKIHTKTHLIENIEHITYDLFTFNEMAQELRDQYYACFHHIEKTFHRDTLVWASNTLKDIDLLTFKIEKYTKRYNEIPNSIFANLSSKKKTIENEKIQLMAEYTHLLSEMSSKKFQLENVHINVPAEGLPHLINFKKIVTAWKENIHSNQASFIKAANRLNTEDLRLNALEMELKTLLEKINDSGILDNKLELNTLSFKKQLEYISNLVYDIDLMMLRIEKNLPYYQWLDLLDDMDEKSKNVIHILRRFDPSEWLTLFESWYHFEILMIRLNFGQQITKAKFEEAENLFHRKQIALIHDAMIHVSKNYITHLSELKSSNPNLHSTMVKKKKFAHPMLWKFLFSRYASFFSGIFPIIISDSDDIDHLTSGVFSDIIYLDHIHNNLEIMQSFEHIISFYSADSTVSNTDFTLSREQNEVTEQLSSVSMTERLRLVRYLTDEMLQFGKIPAVFQLRHACIISFCSDLINDEMNQFLYDFGIKKLHIDTSASETIVGTMLDNERSVYIIVENFLIDPTVQANQYLWQKNVLDRLENAGCNVLNVDTSALLESKGKSLIHVMDIIKGNHIPKTDHKNQFILELN